MCLGSANKTLAYVMRITKLFTDTEVIKTLYTSLVLPKMEYAAMVWSPYYLNHIKRIETVQKKFLKFMAWKVDGVYPERGTDLVELCDRFDFFTLEERRIVTSIVFIIKLLRGNIDCPQFLQQIPLRVPIRGSRYHVPFYLPLSNSCLLLSSPMYRACNFVKRAGG